MVLGPQLMVTQQEQSQLSVLAKRLGLDLGLDRGEKKNAEGEREEKNVEGEKQEENEEKKVQEVVAEEVEEDGVCVMLRWLVWLQNVNTPSGRDDWMTLVHGKDINIQGSDKDNNKIKGSDKDNNKSKGSVQGLLGVNDLLHMVWATHGRSLRLETAVDVPTPLLKVINWLIE